MKRKKRSKRTIPEINTTALPDIIMMLLFFFMVTTVMNDQAEYEPTLPSVDNQNAFKDKSVLKIYLDHESDEIICHINDVNIAFENIESHLRQQIDLLKSEQKYIDKAILYISPKMAMSSVNKLKSALQEIEVLKISCVHSSF